MINKIKNYMSIINNKDKKINKNEAISEIKFSSNDSLNLFLRYLFYYWNNMYI
jgi:hypothetical protein